MFTQNKERKSLQESSDSDALCSPLSLKANNFFFFQKLCTKLSFLHQFRVVVLLFGLRYFNYILLFHFFLPFFTWASSYFALLLRLSPAYSSPQYIKLMGQTNNLHHIGITFFIIIFLYFVYVYSFILISLLSYLSVSGDESSDDGLLEANEELDRLCFCN